MTKQESLKILDESFCSIEASVQDYLGRGEPLLAEVMEDSLRDLRRLRGAICLNELA